MNCSRSLRVGFALAASFACAILRSFGSAGVFIDYPGNTPGLTATVVHQTAGLNATVDSFSTTSNDGDWKLAFGGVPFDPANGVIIPAAYPTYGSDDIAGTLGRAFIEVPGRFTEINPVPTFADGWLSLTDISGSGSEANFDLGLVYFPFSGGWTAGSVSTNGTINAGNTQGVTVARDFDDPGRFTISIAGVDSRTSGMLFTVGGDNGTSGNVVTTEVRADGTGWDIISYDQGGTFTDTDGDAEGDGGENGTFHFVYVPFDAENMLGGRVDDDGTLLNGSTGFTVTRSGTGTYLIKISDGVGGFFDPSDGLVIANVSKGASLGGPGQIAVDPDDNFLEMSYNTAEQGWNVRSFDLSAANLQDTEFVFAFSSYSAPLTVPEPSAAWVLMGGAMLLLGRRARSSGN